MPFAGEIDPYDPQGLRQTIQGPPIKVVIDAIREQVCIHSHKTLQRHADSVSST